MQNCLIVWENVKTKLYLLIAVNVWELEVRVFEHLLANNPVEQGKRHFCNKTILICEINVIHKCQQVWCPVISDFFVRKLHFLKIVFCKLNFLFVILASPNKSRQNFFVLQLHLLKYQVIAVCILQIVQFGKGNHLP